jgi:hypothetical protein
MYEKFTCPIADYHAIWIRFIECIETEVIEGDKDEHYRIKG